MLLCVSLCDTSVYSELGGLYCIVIALTISEVDVTFLKHFMPFGLKL